MVKMNGKINTYNYHKAFSMIARLSCGSLQCFFFAMGVYQALVLEKGPCLREVRVNPAGERVPRELARSPPD